MTSATPRATKSTCHSLSPYCVPGTGPGAQQAPAWALPSTPGWMSFFLGQSRRQRSRDLRERASWAQGRTGGQPQFSNSEGRPSESHPAPACVKRDGEAHLIVQTTVFQIEQMTDSDSSSITLNIPTRAFLVSEAGTRGELFRMCRMATGWAVKIPTHNCLPSKYCSTQ